MEVVIRDDNLEEGLRILKRKVRNDGILRELKQRQCFESRKEKRKRKDALALKRRRQRERRHDRYQ